MGNKLSPERVVKEIGRILREKKIPQMPYPSTENVMPEFTPEQLSNNLDRFAEKVLAPSIRKLGIIMRHCADVNDSGYEH